MTHTMRRATAADVSAVVELLTARAAWLQTRGLDQWSVKDPTRTTAATIADGETWLLTDNTTAEPVGTITWSTTADLDFWGPGELEEPAIYLSKMATRPDQHGQGLGALLVYAAWQYAQQRGVAKLRWDAWRSNQGLQNYYLGLGATAVRSVVVPGRNSGALFEWAHLAPGAESDLASTVRLQAPRGRVGEVGSIIRRPQPKVLGDPEAFGGTAPDLGHWHEITGLVAADLNVDASMQARPPLTVTPEGSGPLLFHSGDTWRVHHLWSREVDGPELARLKPGQLYQLEHVQRSTTCQVVLIGDLPVGGPPAFTPSSLERLH